MGILGILSYRQVDLFIHTKLVYDLYTFDSDYQTITHIRKVYILVLHSKQ